MRAYNFSLSDLSIHKKILLGFLPVFLLLSFLIYASYQSYRIFDKDFQTLQNVVYESEEFLVIQNDLTELQRNILVYSYVGYNGVLKKISGLDNDIRQRFVLLLPMAADRPETLDRFERIHNYYMAYMNDFDRAVSENKSLRNLYNQNRLLIQNQSTTQLNEIEESVLDTGDYQTAYVVKDLQKNLMNINSNIDSFMSKPDAVLINDTRTLFRNHIRDIQNLNDYGIEDDTIDDYEAIVTDYKAFFEELVRKRRSYLNLINVVLPGKAAEMATLAEEIELLERDYTDQLSNMISQDLESSFDQFFILILSAFAISFLFSLIIARGISKPVNAMADTLIRLAKGEKDIEIPGKRRRDEVGVMAKAADEFKIMANELELQTTELEEFSYRTSHDLRSPLISSIGLLEYANKAIKSGDNEKALNITNMVRDSLNKLELLVQDILQLAQTKNANEEITDIDIAAIIDEAILKFSYMDDFDRLEIIKDLKYTKMVSTKKSRLVLIVENLISNAIKYQDKEKTNPYIKLSTYENGDYVVFEVEDNGIGIPEQYHDSIFTMFKRFHPKVSFGSGLGHYMMKKSAIIMGGDIEFHDREKGSMFRLLIPKQQLIIME